MIKDLRILTLLMIVMLLTPLTALAGSDEKITVVQVGMSNGKPAIEVNLTTSETVGDYRLILTNPTTGQTTARDLKINGKTTYAVDNFTANGTYSYELQVNTIKIMSGGVNLTAELRTPDFTAKYEGTTLTLDVANAADYVGQNLTLTSGTFKGYFGVPDTDFRRTFTLARGVIETGTIASSKGNMVTIPIEIIEEEEKEFPVEPETPPTTGGEDDDDQQPTDNGTGGGGTNLTPGGNGGGTNITPDGGNGNGNKPSTGNGNGNKPSTGNGNGNKPSTGNTSGDSTGNNGGTSNGNSRPPYTDMSTSGSNNPSSQPNMNNGNNSSSNVNNNSGNQQQVVLTLTLDKDVYSVEDSIVAEAMVTAPSYAGQSIVINIASGAKSAYKLLTLDDSGRANLKATLALDSVPTGIVNAGVFDVGGNLIASVSQNYTLSDGVLGTPGNSSDGSSTEEEEDPEPTAEYVAVDLREIKKGDAILSVYEAEHLSKYTTKLTVRNETTKETRSYVVYVPDGDSRLDLKVIYDGPGLYTWQLHSGGLLIAKSPFATPIEVENPEMVSQDGLPVLNTAVNKPVTQTHLEGTNPEGVEAQDLGEEIAPEAPPVVSDDMTDVTLNEPFTEEEKPLLPVILAAIGILLFIVTIFVIISKRRKQKEEKESYEANRKYEYDEDEDFDIEDED